MGGFGLLTVTCTAMALVCDSSLGRFQYAFINVFEEIASSKLVLEVKFIHFLHTANAVYVERDLQKSFVCGK